MQTFAIDSSTKNNKTIVEEPISGLLFTIYFSSILGLSCGQWTGMCSKAKTCTVQGLYENSYVWIMVERVFFILRDSKMLLAKTIFFPFFTC